MGDSVNVSWDDAMTTDTIDAIINKYEYGTFDGMTDCAGSRDSVFMDLFGSSRFVNSNRHLSDEAYNKTAVKMGYPQAVFSHKTGQFDGVSYDINEMIKRETWATVF